MASSETTESQYETLTTSRDGGVAVVTLNRPDTLNAINVALAQELLQELEAIAADPSVGCVVLTGAGRAFSSGFDLRNGGVPQLPSGRPDTGWGLRNAFHPVVMALRELPQPVVAAVNGPAVGIGCSYALACDIVVAARSAYFLLAFRNVGLVPDGGVTVLAPARAGLGRALEMALLAERIPAADAHAWGLVNDITDDEQLLSTAMSVANRLADGPPEAQADIKRIINAPYLDQLKSALEREADTQSMRSASDEATEAILAFFEKRAPKYRS